VNRVTVNVSILDDEVDEPTEDFVAALSLQTDNDRVQVTPDTATVDIVDNDGEELGCGIQP
jgi:hypothetical protein